MNITVEKSNPAPIYEQIKLQLRAHMTENNLQEGSPLPDIKTLASMANVSIGTVDRAINELIEEGICYRRPKKGTFVGNLKNLNESKAICGICHSAGLNNFGLDGMHAAIYRGISGNAHAKHADVLFLPTVPSDNISFYLAQSRFDLRGITMLQWEELQSGEKLACEFPQIKFVYINYYLRDFELTPPNVYGVFNDDYAGAYQATEYLLGKGHREIAALSIQLSDENYRQRVRGYKDAMKDNGMEYRKEFICTIEHCVSEDDLINNGERLADEAVRGEMNTTALFCVNDLLAEGAARYLKNTGREGHIEVFGYDNIIPHISRDYGFSTVKIDFEKMGRKTVDILMGGKDRAYPKVLRITPQLLIREHRKKAR